MRLRVNVRMLMFWHHAHNRRLTHNSSFFGITLCEGTHSGLIIYDCRAGMWGSMDVCQREVGVLHITDSHIHAYTLDAQRATAS